ncbi:hypothetical protein [Ureibacillus massiliensis]|uniref:hypothetical protein n=1 Tax=Ureibacillus massiliensis TaxID=292806 RepID=UPI0011314FED|nr:hypothetical protein [Ureibacillus massiliensis]
MNIEMKLLELFKVILQEINVNKEFAKKIETVFTEKEFGKYEQKKQTTRKPKLETIASSTNTSTTGKKRARKRKPALFNPEIVLSEKGKEGLFESLNQLEIDQLKDIVSEYGMDPAKKVMRWRTKEKIVTHILEVTNNWVQKGEAFRRLN